MDPMTAVIAGSTLAETGMGIWSAASNINQARLNRQFQRDMSGTAHQREVADLRAAGLNPILSVMGGHGASTPGGSAASFDNPGRGLSAAAQSAYRLSRIEVAQSDKDLEIKEANKKLIEAQVDAVHTKTALDAAEIPLAKLKGEFWDTLAPFGSAILKALERAGGKESSVGNVVGNLSGQARSAVEKFAERVNEVNRNAAVPTNPLELLRRWFSPDWSWNWRTGLERNPSPSVGDNTHGGSSSARRVDGLYKGH